MHTILAMANKLYRGDILNLTQVELGKEYLVSEVNTQDEELNSFLFSLGCYAGENVTVISRQKSNCVIAIKNARYCIDIQLAQAIIVK